GVAQFVLVLLDEVRPQLLDVPTLLLGVGQCLAVDDVGGALRTHDRDLGRGPGDVDVRAEVFRPHHVVGTAVGLAGDDGDQRDGRLGIGVDEFRAAPDDAVPLLIRAGQETGNIHKGQHGDVERVAGAYESCRFLGRVDVQTPGIL